MGDFVDVTVTNANFTATLVGGFEYVNTATVPVVIAISYGVVDDAGGGRRVVVTVDSSVGCTAISADGVPFTSFAIDDATHVSGIPGSHATGVVNVVVTNATGDGTGSGLLRYWSPREIVGVDAYLDSNKGVTDAGAGAVSEWDDQTIHARAFLQTVGANRPTQTASVFGDLPAIRFAPDQWVGLYPVSPVIQPTDRSVFYVAKWTSTVNITGEQPGTNVPLVIVGDSTGGVYVNAGVSGGGIAYNQYPEGDFVKSSGLNDGTPHLIGWTESTAGPNNLQAYIGDTPTGTPDSVTYNGANNGYDNIGAGYLNKDGYDGDLGAVIVVNGIISGGDLTLLNSWAKQRFGTP